MGEVYREQSELDFPRKGFAYWTQCALPGSLFTYSQGSVSAHKSFLYQRASGIVISGNCFSTNVLFHFD